MFVLERKLSNSLRRDLLNCPSNVKVGIHTTKYGYFGMFLLDCTYMGGTEVFMIVLGLLHLQHSQLFYRCFHGITHKNKVAKHPWIELEF